MSTKDVMRDSLKEVGKGLVSDYFGSLGADLTTLLFFGKPRSHRDQAGMAQAAQLLKEGKHEDVIKLLEANRLGIGLADEMLFLTDLLSLLRLRLLDKDKAGNKQKAIAFYQWVGALTEIQRDKIRMAHVLQKDEEIRRANLIALADMDPAVRVVTIAGAGVLDPNIADTIEELDNQARAALPNLERSINEHKNNIRSRHTRRGGFFSFFNPFK